VNITATQELAEAWRREVSRTERLSTGVVGEARVWQPLGETLGVPARRALEAALRAGVEGWRAVDGGYRHDVEGGYVVYHMREHALEIVAVQAGEVSVEATVSEILSGEVRGTITAEGHGVYFDDGWGNRDEAHAAREAQQDAQRSLAEETRRRVEADQSAREAEVAGSLQERARQRGAADLAQAAADMRTNLARQARDHRERVGLRGRQAFHRLLARGYRDVFLAYAHSHGAQVTDLRDDDGHFSIELQM
jgi:hypothetical protein